MKRRTYQVKLNDNERKELWSIIKSGKRSASEIRHAHILLDLDETAEKLLTQKQVAEKNRVCIVTVHTIGQKYVTGGIQKALERKKRETPPVASKFTGEVEARIVKLACSKAPKGRTRWTLMLLAEETVKLGILDSVSDNGIRMVLKNQHLSLT